MTVMVSEPVRGNTGLYLSITKGSDPAKDFSPDVKVCDLVPEEADDSDLTFYEAAQGGAEVSAVNITAIQSTAVGSLWRFLWDNPGTEVAVVYGPHGNAVATASKPHFLMTVKLNVRPRIGGEARRTKERQDFETTWEVIDGPHLDDGTP